MSIYVNRTLNLKEIKVIGFDMDHTLVRYRTEEFEKIAYNEMVKKLIAFKGYPQKILEKIQFDFHRVVRGLIVDKTKGNILKSSLYGRVKECFHGTVQVPHREMKSLYRSLYIDVKDPYYSMLDTSFSISIGCLYSQLVDLKSKHGDELPSFEVMWEDTVEVLGMSHVDGSLKDLVEKNPEAYICKDEKTVQVLERFKTGGKKLIIVTNSDYHYTKVLLDYAINPYLKEHKDWKELFHIIITGAEKPRFFTDRRRFLKVDPETELMSNWEKPLVSGIFQGGSSKQLEEFLGFSGEKILYLGDHIFGDVVELKKALNWRTALVVEELFQEVDSLNKGKAVIVDIDELMVKKENIEWEYFKVKKDSEEGKKLFAKIKKIDEKLSTLIPQHQKLFNPFWGSVMRAGQEESYYAHKMEQYACIYMPRISDFMEFSTKHYFRPKRRPLPHDVA